MPSVGVILSRLADLQPDGMSPSAEDEAFRSESPDDLTERANYVGASVRTLDGGQVEIVLGKYAQRLLPGWPVNRVYFSRESIPALFLRDLDDAYAAARDEHEAKVKARREREACKICHDRPGTETFLHRERFACRECCERLAGIGDLARRKVADCVRCSAPVWDDKRWRQQVRDWGRSLDLCWGCYDRSLVTVTADGTVSW